jgi:hypothetical protein
MARCACSREASDPVEIAGACHCGNLAFSLFWPDTDSLPARGCGCGFCVKHGGVWTSNPDASLVARLERPENVARYEFGTKTATFHTCTRCGVVPFVTSVIDGHTYAVVNVNTFDKFDRALLRVTPASFDGEGVGERLARRARNWIGDVSFETRGE